LTSRQRQHFAFVRDGDITELQEKSSMPALRRDLRQQFITELCSSLEGNAVVRHGEGEVGEEGGEEREGRWWGCGEEGRGRRKRSGLLEGQLGEAGEEGGGRSGGEGGEGGGGGRGGNGEVQNEWSEGGWLRNWDGKVCWGGGKVRRMYAEGEWEGGG